MIIGFAFAVEVFRSTLKSIIRSNFISHARYVERLLRRCVHPAAAENSNFFSSRTWRCLISHQSLDLDCIMNSYIFSYIFQASAEDCRRKRERKNIDYYVYACPRATTIFFPALGCFFSGACRVRFLSVFITALILHSTDYFMLHFAPCRCSMSFVMISALANRPKASLMHTLESAIGKRSKYFTKNLQNWSLLSFRFRDWLKGSMVLRTMLISHILQPASVVDVGDDDDDDREGEKGNKKYIASEVASEAESQAANNNKCAR